MLWRSASPARRPAGFIEPCLAKTWSKLKGENQLPKVVQRVTFRDGVDRGAAGTLRDGTEPQRRGFGYRILNKRLTY
jgi:hypothetical protein